MENHLLDRGEVCRYFGGNRPINAATLYRGIRHGRYPKPVKIGVTPTITATTGTTDTGIPASLKREAPKKYDFHPLADLFPMLEDKSAAFEALVEDIRERKQQEPVWL